MQKSQFTDEQIVAILQQAGKGEKTIAVVCRQHTIADPLAERQTLVTQAQGRGVSERHACRLATVARSSVRHKPHPRDDRTLRGQLETIKQKYPRFGIPRTYALLRADGQSG